MTSQRHIIKRQILDLHISSDLKAFEVQNKISTLYRSQIIPLIEAYCNQISDPDQIYRIDHLEIDIGTIEAENWELDFVQKVTEAITKELSEQTASRPSKSLSSVSQTSSATNSEQSKSRYSTAKSRTPQEVSNNSNPKPINLVDANLELLHHFLQTGCLPWWSESLDQHDLEDYFRILLTKAPQRLSKLLQNNLKKETQRQRILYQFSEGIQLEILKLLAPNWHPAILSYFADIEILIPYTKSWQNIDFPLLKQTIRQGVLLQLALHPSFKPSIDIILKENLLHIATQFKILRRSLLEELQSTIEILSESGTHFVSQLPQVLYSLSKQNITQESNPENWRQKNIKKLIERLAEFLNSNLNSIASNTSYSHIKTTSKELNKVIEQDSFPFSVSQLKYIDNLVKTLKTQISKLDQQVLSANLAQITPDIEMILQAITNANLSASQPLQNGLSKDIFATTNQEEEIYIQNSGLILLWPFLNRFFESLGLAQSGKFSTTDTTNRAILLLQYLIDGSTESLEHLLPLNKLLCGLSIGNPIPHSLVLSDNEETECEELLFAVIQNWLALKNMSIDGLRRSFLQRNGVLKVNNSSYLLRVENKTYDILIDQLPWTIKIIKLPYMHRILQVEW